MGQSSFQNNWVGWEYVVPDRVLFAVIFDNLFDKVAENSAENLLFVLGTFVFNWMLVLLSPVEIPQGCVAALVRNEGDSSFIIEEIKDSKPR